MDQQTHDHLMLAPDEQDRALRPRRLSEFIGQQRLRENLRIYIEASRLRGDVLDHVLLVGLPGLGKTTLAGLIATELGRELHTTSGPVLEKAGDLAGLLTNLQPGDVLFIDEIHRLSPVVEEYLYSAMEDFHLDIVIDQGPSARTIKIDLEPFTLIGATTREGLLTPPFRARFGVMERLEPYPTGDLVAIIERSARLLGISIAGPAAVTLAQRSRGTPRRANHYLRRLRDVALVAGVSHVDGALLEHGMTMLGVDAHGLVSLDRDILRTLYDGAGKPVGLKTIAATIGEQPRTIEEVYEPYLIQSGLVQKTARGRVLTERARDLCEHLALGRPRPRQPQLFD